MSLLNSLTRPEMKRLTAYELAGLPQPEARFIQNKLNAALQLELNKFRDEILKNIPQKQSVFKKIFEKLSALNYQGVLELSLAEIVSGAMSENDRRVFTSEELEAISGIFASRQRATLVKNILRLDVPLHQHPLLVEDIRQTKSLLFASIVGLNSQKSALFVNKNLDVSNLDRSTADDLVKEQILTSTQREELLFASKLSVLSGEHFEMVKAVKASGMTSLGGLIGWEQGDWLKLIKDRKLTIPLQEKNPESYAENIRKTIEASFPTDYFLQRLINDQVFTRFTNLIGNIKSLFQYSTHLFPSGTSETPDWEAAGKDGRKFVKLSFEELLPLVATYRHLGVAEVLNGRQSLEEKQAEVAARLNALKVFYHNNPNLDLRSSDFTVEVQGSDGDGWVWTNINRALQPLVKKQMGAFQRAFILGGSQSTADLLLKSGLDSGAGIIQLSEAEFIQTSGLGTEKGRRVYAKANDLALGAAHYFEAIRDSQQGGFGRLAVSNQHSLINDLNRTDGLDLLFGRQDHCDCAHCRSILSPAAYFTDLMYFVEENVTKKVFTGNNSAHLLALPRRRPDLWTLQLSCQNTTQEIPYLSVVNDVLEKYLMSELSVIDIYETLKRADGSVNQPFHLDLEELRLYTGHFGMDLHDLYQDLQVGTNLFHREVLKLSEEEENIIRTKDLPGARKRFGDQDLNHFAVPLFLNRAGISRQELDELLKCTFLPEISKVKVNTIKDNSDIQLYREELANLTETRLDLIHRYLRLWKKTPWNLPAFDLLLSSLKAKGVLTGLGGVDGNGYSGFLHLAPLILIQRKLNLSVEELTAITWELPTRALNEGGASFADRYFDLQRITDPAVTNKTPLLLAGLGISEADLVALAEWLSIDLTQTTTVSTLSDLYRHVRIAGALGLTIEELIHAAALALNRGPIRKLDDIQKLIGLVEWMAKSPLSISEAVFILHGTENGSVRFAYDLQAVAQMVLGVQIAESGGGDNDQVGGFPEKHQRLRQHLQSLFSLTEEQFNDEFLNELISVDFETVAAQAFNASFSDDQLTDLNDLNGLLQLVRQLERYTLLFRQYRFKPSTISFVIRHKDAFGIGDLKALNVNDIRMLSLFRQWTNGQSDREEKLKKVLVDLQTGSSFMEVDKTLSELWDQPVNLIQSLTTDSMISGPAMFVLETVWTRIRICGKLGIQGHALKNVIGSDYKLAKDIMAGAFAAKYAEESIRNEKLEPYTDQINTLKRDALCDYIISRNDIFRFNDREDLYAFFLLSVDMGGCFRTSKLVAAITSLQLYIHRCLTNLERSDVRLYPNLPGIRVLPSLIPSEEWEWRKNYRVWEANRKVFLYPENYLDPTLRDNKTSIFKELEEELLQQMITTDSAEVAYKKYFSRFSELTRVQYAGAYYHQIHDHYGYVKLSEGTSDGWNQNGLFLITGLYLPVESEDSCFYLFARTNVEPYQYFYQIYNHHRKIFGNWTKIDLAIEAKEISALIHQGRLYIFWTEVTSKELNKFEGGDSKSDGYIFNAYVKYSFQNEAGQWSVPQRLWVGQDESQQSDIYARSRKRGLNNSIWEKEKEAILEDYMGKVFRKPYAFINGADKSKPIGLSYIWTNDKNNQKVRYTTAVLDRYDYGSYKISIPSQSFTIEDSDFTNAVRKVTVSIFLDQHSWKRDGALSLDNEKCTLEVGFNGLQIYVSVPYSIEILEKGSVSESTYYLSLSKNKVTEPSHNIFSGSPLTAYWREYVFGYAENGDMATHIENGSKGLTEHVLMQHKNSRGGLLVSGRNSLEFVPLHTVLTDELGDQLFAKGLPHFLSLQTQQLTDEYGQQFDFRGPYGAYYWEMFFHIPFLIANHFNANQKFKEAKWWYERIFNPTADETPGINNQNDNPWQFREFRGLTLQKFKDILTDAAAIEAYKKDPFDAHAIARLRISAYQKAVVMKYIDNLLDWGDYLFVQDTRESINEAEMLYQIASGILGKRPAKVGKCETADEDKLTYDELGSRIKMGSEFLINLENRYWIQKYDYDREVGLVKSSKSLSALVQRAPNPIDFKQLSALTAVKKTRDLTKLADSSVSSTGAGVSFDKFDKIISYDQVVGENPIRQDQNVDWESSENTIERNSNSGGLTFQPHPRYPSNGVVRLGALVFCVPENPTLMGYWDRVEDRLYKIWHCMNIKGIRRSLALFQPPLDPMMLVRLQAAGLSLEDVTIGAYNGIPNYRFVYLLEKAKQYAQTVQSFGSAFLSALEKKDGEELILLRSVHEKNILRLSSEIKRKQIQEAKVQLKSTSENLKTVENRIAYYSSLINSGLNAPEVTQQVSRNVATAIKRAESVVHLSAALKFIIPQSGSPFAMTYGGRELGWSGVEFAQWTGSMAAITDSISASAGLEASFQRREEEWKQQLKLAEQEWRQVSQLLIAGEIRQQIAERDLEIHEKNLEQVNELDDFYRNKFTNLGLYNYMASHLARLFRSAYQTAYEMARSAEKSYQFERYDNEVIIQSDNWQLERAGLLAGEKLFLQLQQLEKKYLDNHVRTPEITQTFSLALLDPSQLIELRQKGRCQINIPEIAFEMLYPGQFRRIIKSVRLSIPCVAGPYTNISAKLTLLNSEVVATEGAPLGAINIGENTSITTSSANNDAGMFELNFRDERYLPFEGAGAISTWQLELPSTFRSFNYNSIADVILHMSYTAMDGDRVAAENALADSISNYARNKGLFRLISLRHEFRNAYHKLLSQENQITDFDLTNEHFPYSLQQHSLKIYKVQIYLKPRKGRGIATPANLKINGNHAVRWNAEYDISVPGYPGDLDKIKGGEATITGSPIKKWTIEVGNDKIDKENLEDLLILIRYRI